MVLPIGTEEAQPRRHFPLVTLGLIAVNAFVFYQEVQRLAVGGEASLAEFIDRYAVIPASIASGEGLITLVTAQFLHGGLLHIGFNMLFLLVFGDNIEDRLGKVRFLVFYLLTGVLASLTQVFVDPASAIPSLGASGAIAGILGGYILLHPDASVKSVFFLGPIPLFFRISAFVFLAVWFITQFFVGVTSLGVPTQETGGVAYFAHIGGFVAGLVLVKLFVLGTTPPSRLRY